MDSILQGFSQKIGLDLATFKLLSSLFVSYILSTMYRSSIKNFSINFQYMYFTISGLLLMYFNYGYNTLHSTASVAFTYAVVQLLPGTTLSVILAFVGLMGHLLYAYSFTSLGDYDMSWSMPHCVLTLRLIGLVWDVYDGQQQTETLSHDVKKTALKHSPGLLEIFAYTYMYCSVLVGPQFPLSRLRSLVNGEFEEKNRTWRNVVPAVSRLFLGIFYGTIVVMFYYDSAWYLSVEFQDLPFYRKILSIALWSKIFLYRYVFCWLITEGSCILNGISYNGRDSATNVDKWDGVRNVQLTQFEFGCTFKSMVQGFNYNTNQWALKYIFKRLKFLNNKNLSHLLTLIFLALWHGVYTGYFACFLFEFVCVMAEKQATLLLERMPRFDFLIHHTILYYPVWAVKKCIVVFDLAFGLLPFSLIKLDQWWPVYTQIYFVGWVVYFILWQLILKILLTIVPKTVKKMD